MAYATAAEYKAVYTEDADIDNTRLSAILDEASDTIDGELANAGVTLEDWESEYASLVKRICMKVAHRSVGNDGFGEVPYGTTQVNMSAGSYSRGFSFGSEGFGDVFLTRNEKLQLGIGRSKACVLSPYGGES